MVTDTACQRLVCGQSWLDAKCSDLARHGLETRSLVEQHRFKFGAGDPKISVERAQIPVGLAGITGILRASVVDADITCLGSRTPLQA